MRLAIYGLCTHHSAMICIGFITCTNKAEAEKVAKHLLEKRLIACGNIIPGIESHYRWKGKLESSNEVLLLVKTLQEKTQEIISETRKVHSYDLPAIEFIQVGGNEEALEKWVNDSLQK